MMPPRHVVSRLGFAVVLLCSLAHPGRAAPDAPQPPATSAAEQSALQLRQPTKALLLDVARAGPRFVAVGVQGVIVRADESGANWEQAQVPVSSMLTCVAFADADRGWAAGHSGVILATRDGGRSWTRLATPATVDDSFLDIIALPNGRVLAGGAYGLYMKSEDGGATWTIDRALDEDLHINRIVAGPSGALYLAAEAGALARSTDGGATWERLESPYEGSFYGLHELASGRLLAHGLRGHVFVSDDRGASWSPGTIDVDGLIASAAELAPGVVVVSGAGGRLFISRDAGSTFSTDLASGLTATAEAVAGPNGSVLCVGDTGVRVVALLKP